MGARAKQVYARLLPSEQAAFRLLQARVGGEAAPASDSDAMRLALREACERRGIAWPKDDAAPAPGAVTPPHPHATGEKPKGAKR